MESFKASRMSNGISQAEVARQAGVSVRYVKMFENGERTVSPQARQKIESALNFLCAVKSNRNLEVIVDYLKIHFKTKAFRFVIEKILQIPFEGFERESRGNSGFAVTYSFGDIFVLHQPYSTDHHTMLELRGLGRRQFECQLEILGWTWYDFFDHVLSVGGDFKVNRLDLAVNDVDGILSVPELIQKCKDGELDSSWLKKFTFHESGERLSRTEFEKALEMGSTLYLGAPSSLIRFCIYEKELEQLAKKGIPVEEADVKNRFEVRLKRERASEAIRHIVETESIEGVALDITERYVSFVDIKDSGACLPNQRWEKFMGENRGELRLTTKPKPKTFDDTRGWFKNGGVLSSMVMLQAVDDMDGTNWLQKEFDKAALSYEQAKRLKHHAEFRKRFEDAIAIQKPKKERGVLT